MNKRLISRRSLLLASAVLPAMPRFTHAQDSLEWVVGYAPGGGSDLTVRLIADHVARNLGRPIVVVNKPGGATAIAAQYVAAAKVPMLFSADFATLAANPYLFSKLAYNAERDFALVGMLARAPMVLVAAPQLPVANLAELIAWVKAKPEGSNFASAGPGSPHHLVGEQVRELLGLKLSHVAYRGASPALVDLVGGQVPMAMMDLGSAYPYASSGKVKALAVATLKRIPQLPEVPTFAELGYTNYEAYAWQSVVASSATPAELRQRVNQALNSALALPDIKERLNAMGVEALPTTPQEAIAYTSSERVRWGAVITKNNIRID